MQGIPKLGGKWNVAVAAATLTSIVAASSFWGANCPALYDVRRMNSMDTYSHADLIFGGCKGTIEASAVALGASFVVKSYWPLVGTLSYMAFHWMLYDRAFKGDVTDTPTPFVAAAETSEINEGY